MIVSWWGLPAMGVAAVAARLGAFLVLDRFRHPEVWESETIALNLLNGHGFIFRFLEADYRSYMEPLYPALCALVYAVTGHHPLGLGLVHVMLGTALVGLVYACAWRITHSGGAAFMAAALTAFHPALIVFTTKFHPFILDSLLLLAVLAGCLWCSSARPWWSAARLGLLIGACTLSRPTILAASPLLGWWVVRSSAGSWRRRLLVLALVAVCAGGVVAPWVWRNYRVHGRFMVTRSGTPMVFWIGNNPYRFTGSALTPEGEAILIDVVPARVQEQIYALDELGQQDFFLQQALQHVRAHPGAFVRRWWLKWWYFWWFSPQAGLRYPAAWLTTYQAFYVALWLCIGVSLGAHWWNRSAPRMGSAALALLLGLCGLIAVAQSVCYIEGRHRLAIEPFLIILAGHGLWRLWSLAGGNRALGRS